MHDTSHHLFTSESVSEGHPDKMCDQISDAVLDAHLVRDPCARVACETLAAGDMITVAGEISSKDPLSSEEIEAVVRGVIARIGYTDSGKDYWGFSAKSCEVRVALNAQSPDIAQGVDDAYEHRVEHDEDPFDRIGAGDQGLMFGYACSETPQRMPLAITLAHALTQRLAKVRRDGIAPNLLPDSKSQVTLRYEGGRPVGIDTIVVSTQHTADADQGLLAMHVADEVVMPVLREHWAAMIKGDDRRPSASTERTLIINPTADEMLAEHNSLSRGRNGIPRGRMLAARPTPRIRLLVNPTGKFVIGGPVGDAGLTGRKIIVDTYGGMARHGGGAFSGKDATKVDRSAAYAARHAARNVVAAGLAERCEVQVAYAIGVAHPVSVMVDTFGTGTYADDLIATAVAKVFDMRPAAIIERLDLRSPRFERLAAYGHFGRPELDLPWEREDHVQDLIDALS